MPKTRKLTDDGDWEYKAGRPVMIEGADYVSQGIRVGMGHIKGENLFHVNLGFDLSAFHSKSDSERIAAAEEAALATGRVRRVIESRFLDEPSKTRRRRLHMLSILTDGQREIIEVVV